MLLRIGMLSSLLLASSCTTPSQTGGAAVSSRALSEAAAIAWPALPADGFVSGRAATGEDVLTGRAAFSMQVDGRVVGQPLPIAVPQYAFRVVSGKRTPGIVIQAEAGQGKRMLGFRALSKGTIVAAPESEFELLGTSIPPPPATPAR